MADELRVVDIKLDKQDIEEWYTVTAKLSDGRTVTTEAAISEELVADWPVCRIVMAGVVMQKIRKREAAVNA